MIYIECFVILICFIIVIFIMLSNNRPYPHYRHHPREHFQQPTSFRGVDDLVHLNTGGAPPPPQEEEEEDSDTDDVEPPLPPQEEEDIELVENDGQENSVLNPADLPSTYRIPTTVPGFNSLFDIHNDPDCCSSKPHPIASKKCYTKQVRENQLKKIGKKHKPLLQKSTCGGNNHPVDPAGVLCYSKEPHAIPIEYSPDSCLPPPLASRIYNKNDCFDQANLVYTPDPVDPIDYTVRKGILNPPGNTDSYVQAVVDPGTNNGFAMDFR